jgi:septal ring factor EnvC (AmiA/AmiB activator)
MKKIVSIAILAIITSVIFASAATPKKRSDKPVASSTSLKNERQQTKREINDTKRKIDDNSRRTRDQLDQLNQITGQITNQRHTISLLQTRIDSVSTSIKIVQDSIDIMNGEVAALRQDLKKALRTMRSRRQTINNMSFIFSAPTFTASMKRIAYIKQMNTWRNKKISQLKSSIERVDAQRVKLEELRGLHASTLTQLSAAQSVLATRQSESEKLVGELRREGSSLQRVLADKQKKLRELDNEIDRIIAEEQRRAEEQRKAEEKRRADE